MFRAYWDRLAELVETEPVDERDRFIMAGSATFQHQADLSQLRALLKDRTWTGAEDSLDLRKAYSLTPGTSYPVRAKRKMEGSDGSGGVTIVSNRIVVTKS